MTNPFERNYSATEDEKKKAEEEGGEEAVKKLEENMETATARAEGEKEPNVVELSEKDIKDAENFDPSKIEQEIVGDQTPKVETKFSNEEEVLRKIEEKKKKAEEAFE